MRKEGSSANEVMSITEHRSLAGLRSYDVVDDEDKLKLALKLTTVQETKETTKITKKKRLGTTSRTTIITKKSVSTTSTSSDVSVGEEKAGLVITNSVIRISDLEQYPKGTKFVECKMIP